MPATTEVKIRPFGVEIDTPRNQDVMLQCIPGCRLRGAVRAGKTVRDQQGNESISPDQVAALGQFPPMSGMQIHVNPERCTYTIVDPMRDDEELLSKVKKAMDRRGAFRTDAKLNGVELQKGELDVHRMKSLCRELLWLLDSDHAKMVKGTKPTMEDVEELPGNFLLNPGSRVPNSQPLFEKDLAAWVAQLNKSGV